MNTKEKIIETAKSLFLQKGFEQTSIREIAIKAGINIAAMNYHFGSKETLFDIIFEKLITNHEPSLPDILNTNYPLEEKVMRYIEAYTEILLANQQLPLFIMSVLHKNPKKIMKMNIFNTLYNTEAFAKQVEEEAEKGNIIKIDPTQLFINILSMVSFPFAIKEVIIELNHLDEKGFTDFILQRKQIIYDTIIQSIKIR